MTRTYIKWVDAPIWVKVGRNIRDCRKWKKYTPEKLAFEAKIDLKRFKRIERGLTEDITIYEALRIQHVLQVSQEEIIPLL